MKLDASHVALAKRSFERARQSRRSWSGTRGEHEKHGSFRRPVQEADDEIDRGCVGPVKVVEDEHQRLGRSQPFEQLAHRTVGPIALTLKDAGAGAPNTGQRGEDVGELGAHLLAETVESSRVDALDVLVEGVDEDPEREVAFELGARSGQDDVSTGIGASGEFRDEPGLADPGSAYDFNGTGSPGRQLVEGVVEPLDLCAAPYEIVGKLEDGSSPRLYARAEGARAGNRHAHWDLRPGWRPDVVWASRGQAGSP